MVKSHLLQVAANLGQFCRLDSDRRNKMLKLENGKIISESDTLGKVVLDEMQVAAVELLIKKYIEGELHQNQ